VFTDGFQAQAQLNIASTDIPSAAICQGVELATSTAKKPVTLHSQWIRQCCLADVFVPGDKNAGPLFLAQESCHAKFGPALISIGANTDAALDRLSLGDEFLLKLRILIGTTRSSKWEAVFRSPKWNLTYEQSVILSKALLADLQPEAIKVGVFSYYRQIHSNSFGVSTRHLQLCCPSFSRFLESYSLQVHFTSLGYYSCRSWNPFMSV
jgi:hypothetical protein